MTVNGLNWNYGSLNDKMKLQVEENAEFFSSVPFDKLREFFCVKPLVEMFSHLTVRKQIIVLNELTPFQSSELFKLLTEENRLLILHNLQEPQSFLLSEIAEVGGEIYKNLPYLSSKQEKNIEPLDILANIIKYSEKDTEKQIFTFLKENNKKLFQQLKVKLKNAVDFL